MKSRALFVFVLLFSTIMIQGEFGGRKAISVASLETRVINISTSDSNTISINSEDDEAIVVLVNYTLWQNQAVKDAVNLYLFDLNNTGFDPILYTNQVNNVVALKALLQGWYISDEIIGAVLIGEFPHEEFYHNYSYSFPEEVFICDLYLMDLDGIWEDNLLGDGIYDTHYGETGFSDIYPEIYISRIDATTRTFGTLTDAEEIVRYLNRCHDYRIGGIKRSESALMYIDDDWRGYASSWTNWLSNAYSNITSVHTPATATNAADWMERLEQDYQWAHICAHSNEVTQYLRNDEIYEPINNYDIDEIRPKFNFYTLFSCHANDWSVSDCLGVTYLFSSDYSLGVLSSTKVGGILHGEEFYDNLALERSVGLSLYNWYQGIDESEYSVNWFYGMCLFGDPFLTINVDDSILNPQLISQTHPNSDVWYTSAKPIFNWTEPLRLNGVVGYYYILDQLPITIPTEVSGTFTTSTSLVTDTPLTEGIYYLHLRTKDGSDLLDNVTYHKKIKIDNQNPVVTIDDTLEGLKNKPGDFELQWEVIDSLSGCKNVVIRVNGLIKYNLDGDIIAKNLSLLTNGLYEINITAYDYAGLSATDQITIMIYDFSQTVYYPIVVWGSVGLGGVGILTAVIIMIIRRVRKPK